MPKIGLVTPFDIAHAGGVNEHVSQLAAQFRRLGHQVRIIAPASRPVSDPSIYAVGRITPVQINGSVARVSLSPGLGPRMRQIVRDEGFDVLHLHEPFSPTFCITMLRASDTLTVGTFHAAAPRSLAYATAHRWLGRLAPRLHGRIAVSTAARRLIQRYVPGQYEILPNGVNTRLFHPEVLPLPAYQDDLYNVLFVGRFNDERKGFRYLLEALGLVRESLPRLRLIVAGSGDPGPFRQQLRQLHLRDVVFTGYVSDEHLARLYRTAHVFCAPSVGQESFGIVLLEAMATGCAIVAADNPGYREVVDHRRQGLLVQPRHAEALAVALLQVLGDERLRNALASNGLVKAQRFSWEYVARDVLHYYDRVASRSSATLVEVPS